MPNFDRNDRRAPSTTRLRLVAKPLDLRRAERMLDAWLATMGAGRLAQLLVESAHRQADHLAMAGRAEDALPLRRYAGVITRAARELRQFTDEERQAQHPRTRTRTRRKRHVSAG